MKKNKSKTPFAGTPEQEKRLDAAIESLADQKGALLPVMQAAQEISENLYQIQKEN